MANERIEAEFTVPASSSVSVTTVAQSATTVTATTGTAFMSGLVTDLQTQLNNNSQGYPQTAAAMAAAVAAGTWTAGWLFNETSPGNAIAAFGGNNLSLVSTPVQGLTGYRGGIDKAIGFDSNADSFSGGDNYDVNAASDLAIAWVGNFGANTLSNLVTKGTAGVGSGKYSLYLDGSNAIRFDAYRETDGASILDIAATDASFFADVWHVGIATIDRATGKARVGIRALVSGTTALSTETTIAASDTSSANDFLVGVANVATTPPWKMSALYVATGAGAAAGISAGLSTALSNFANAINSAWTVSMSASTGLVSIGWTGYATPTWSLSWTSTALRNNLGFTGNISGVTSTQTGTEMPAGVWLSGCNLAIDSDPLQAPTGDDKAASISPTGRVYSIASSTYFRHRNVRFPHVAQSKVWANSASTVGEDWETFYLETQVGQNSWFEVGSRVVVYWDRAGTLTELGNGDVEAWRMPKCTKLDDLQLVVNTWTGLVAIDLGDLFSDE